MKKWNLYILALLLFGACTNEDGVNPQPVDPPVSDDLTTLTLKFPKSYVDTKAFTAGEENRVGDLDILVFTQATGTGVTLLDDSFAYSIKVPAADIVTSTSTIDGDTKTAKIKVQNMEKAQRFILLANLPSGCLTATDTSSTAVNTKLSTIVSKLRSIPFSATWMKDKLNAAVDSGFPMWGQMSNHELFHHTNPSPSTSVTINMIRAVSRIDVGLNINGGDPPLGFGSITDIDSVYLCNAYTKGYIVPNDLYLARADSAAKDRIYKQSVPAHNNTTERVVVGYDFVKVEANTMARTIYTPESDSINSPAGNKPAFLVVKAKYYGDYFYYRVDFTESGKFLALLRNHRYTINILGAKRKGYDTLQEALDSPPESSNPNLTFDVDQLELKEIVTNDEYYLAYSANNIKIDWNGQINIPVMTDYPTGWTATATGATLSVASGNANTLGYVKTTSIPNITSGGEKYYTVTIKAGTLTRTINVTQIIGSNSYVTPLGTGVYIPVNSVNLGGSLPGSATIKVATVWSTTGTGVLEATVTPTDIIYVPASGTTGNIVIALTSDGGPGMVGGIPGESIVWTWHVWVTEAGYNPVNTARSNNGYQIMNRNLGALGATASHYGLYYQWGRSVPFNNTAVSPTSKEAVAYANNLGTAIKNPTIFYTVTGSPFDWIGTSQGSQNNSLWTTSAGEKGAYDPCPFGWRVPAYDSEAESPWYGISSSNSNGLIFPLAGGLSMSNGALTGETTSGYVWGASARGQQAAVFNFTGSTSSHGQAYRANGYQIRCVRDVKRK